MGNIPLHATVIPEMAGDPETCFLPLAGTSFDRLPARPYNVLLFASLLGQE